MDQQLLVRIGQTFEKLSSRLSLLDENGMSLVPHGDTLLPLPDGLESGSIISMYGSRYLAVPGQRCTLLAPEGTPDDVLRIGAQLVETLIQLGNLNGGISGAYQRMLQNDLSVAEQDAVISEYRIPDEMPRCVLLFHMMQVQGNNARDILNEVLPMSVNDVLIAMDTHTAALIKCTAGMDDIEDLRQLASAMQETIISETGLPVTIGIGKTTRKAGELHQSYRQARRAIEIGRIYRQNETVHIYSSLLLERFLSDIPPETAEHYHGLLFNRSTSRLFSEEILSTVEMFFRKDLNLSDTARQLYIHRNTLVYRLDKVQRQIGLDLRKFDDAVTFKMLMEMKKCTANKTKITL
ncbi:MAG: helix-turn-helix domain-containing protein [Clostridia bacterium]|nr:helix-turn-helix domain-containing protein [Clostridia bacterium]